MIDLKIQPTRIALVCSSCDEEWQVVETEPFVAQLRLITSRHSCAAIADVIDVRDFRRDHARLT